MAGAARFSFFPQTLRRKQPSTTMQALTSSFPLSTRGHNGVQLNNIIFYSGPAFAKMRETTLMDTDEWSNVEMIFADASQQEWAAATKQLELNGGFNIINEDEPCSQCLYSDLPFNVLVFRLLECN